MIKLASPDGEGSSREDNWLAVDRNQPQANLIIVQCLEVSNKYRYTGQFIGASLATDAHDSSQAASGGAEARKPKAGNQESGVTLTFWTELADGLFALVFMAIVFCLSAWLLCNMSLDLASFGNIDLSENLRRELLKS